MSKFKIPENKKIPELEADMLSFWKKNKTFEKSVEQRSEEDLYVFYDGPPFISGLPHPGHLLVGIAKDVLPRYWTMKGKRVERVWGWDAHGLTVENKVQKKLGIKNRTDIEDYGLEKFTKECYTYTSETSAEWNWYVDKIGRWVDMDNAYKTIDQDYMESVMWVFKELYDKKLIYEGVRTSLFCTTCGTPVSNFEVAMDNTYKDVEDPSIMVKFKLKEGEFKDAFVLAWTTTPWTVPSNRGLVVDENETYVLVSHENSQYVVAQKRLVGAFENKEHKIIKEFSGKDLVGLSYDPPYTFFAPNENDFKIYNYDGMVHMEEGTGIVHSAPGFGMVDTEMGRKFDLTMMLTINDSGEFIAGDNGENPFEGMYYKKANKYIREDLNNRDLLFRDETITHRFPYHDRCNTLLIQKAQNSWFVDVMSLKNDMYKNNEDINWVPSHLKDGRFKQGIEQAPDWAISRSRFWATPMPVWRSEDGDTIVIGSVKELEELSGKKVTDLHRPYIDEITFVKNGKEYKRIPDVLDSWFEAGSMPYAQVHYPFENKDKFNGSFPGDYIVEYIAQTRAWFYVMHVLSTALFNKNSFKNVISTGVLAGNDGRKMSKTYGNFTDPKEILNQLGGDCLRLYFMTSPLMIGGNANFDDKEIKTKLNNVLNPLWNSTKFFLIYASEYNWDPKDYADSENVLDVWIKVRLNQAIKDFTVNIEDYLVPNAVTPLEEFVDDLSRWYVRRSRDRISQGDNEALSTLFYVLKNISLAFAPVIPFMSENIYQSVVAGVEEGAMESVHLCDFPGFDEEFVDDNKDILRKMDNTRDIASLGSHLRSESKIKIRQPLGNFYLYVKDSDDNRNTDFFDELIKDEINVKEIILINDASEIKDLNESVTSESNKYGAVLDMEISEDLEVEGAAREIVRTLQSLRKQNGLQVSDIAEFTYKKSDINDKAIAKFGDEIKEKVSAKSITASGDFSLLQ